MRKRTTARVALVLASMTLAFGGCKASKEDLIKSFQEKGTAVTTYSTKYPQFATLLKAKHAEQKKVFDKSKEDVEKLKAVNAALNVVVGPLDTYERRVKRINKLYNDYNVRKNKGHKVRDARAKANKKLSQAAEVIANAKPTNIAEYTTAMTQANGYLRQSLDHLERLQRKGRKKSRKKRKKKNK